MGVMSGGTTDLAQCQNSQVEEILRTDSGNSCSPRKVIVKVDSRTDHPLLAPSHLEVRRCVGSCGHYHHSCLPLQTNTITVPALVSEASAESGVRETLCGEVEVEEHTQCGCGCELSGESCASNQEFLPFECRCVCTNHHQRDDCLARGWTWDRTNCLCSCPNLPYPTCPNNLMFDYLETCSCVPTHSRAGIHTISLAVALTSLLLISVFTLTKYLINRKKRIGRKSKIFHLSSKTKAGDMTALESREFIDLLGPT